MVGPFHQLPLAISGILIGWPLRGRDALIDVFLVVGAISPRRWTVRPALFPTSQEVQNAVMYLQKWVRDLTSMPKERSGGNPVPADPHVWQRSDVATKAHEVHQYFIEDAEARGGTSCTASTLDPTTRLRRLASTDGRATAEYDDPG